MKILAVSLLLASIFQGAFSQGQDSSRSMGPHPARERSFDVLHYRLKLDLDVKGKRCAGNVAITLVPLRTFCDVIQLDAAELSVLNVSLSRISLHFTHRGDTLTIELDKPYGLTDTLTLEVAYQVTAPTRGLYFIAPDSGSSDGQWQAWTQGEPDDNHHWFPCYDYPNDKVTSEMIVTVDAPFVAVSNGALIDVKRDVKGKKTTYHWRENLPHVSYGISLAVAEYVEVKDSWGAVPLSHFVYKNQQNDAMRSFGKTPAMLDFFSSVTGYPYPWEKYGHALVRDFVFAGQENISIATLTDKTIHDSRAHLDNNSDGLVAHELAHQWWGDLVSFRDWSHAWLSEGFATYFDFLFQGHDKGNDELLREIFEAQQNVTSADVRDHRRPTVTNVYERPIKLFDNRIYAKGGCVLHMLRFVLGDDLFWKAMRHYVHKFAFGNVETNDFKIAIEEATGYNLKWFFDEWVYGAGYPEFLITTRWDQSTRSVKVNVKQQQHADSLTPGVFAMPVEIEVWVHDAPETYRVNLQHREEEFSFPAYQNPQLVIFDKGSRLLKTTSFQKSPREWSFQLTNAADGVDRMIAADELRWSVDSADSYAALTKALLDDRFWSVRRQAAWSLGESRKNAGTYLVPAYGDRDARVRAAVVAALGAMKGDAVVQCLQHAFQHDSSYAVNVGALRSLCRVDSAHGLLHCREALGQDTPQDVLRIAALNILSTYHDEESLTMIQAASRPGRDRNVRILAYTLMGREWLDREDVVRSIASALSDPIVRVRRAVIDVLGKTHKTLALPLLRNQLQREEDDQTKKLIDDAIGSIEKANQ